MAVIEISRWEYILQDFVVVKNDQRLFFSGDITAADPCHNLSLRPVGVSERAESTAGFFRMAVELVKLKQKGLQRITELSRHKCNYFSVFHVMLSHIQAKNNSMSSKICQSSEGSSNGALYTILNKILSCVIQNYFTHTEKRPEIGSYALKVVFSLLTSQGCFRHKAGLMIY